ncbi:tgb1 [Tamus red mosaic virus]|uniref:Tgb1 n=1 Tax=Tamus red mosaic virus TaxID=1081702 RepID=G3LHV5_9VIRU|nr:tgb1 [Tamus red mosaic virus]AEO12141.1 tgb1 [Tamus red mosaic virus]
MNSVFELLESEGFERTKEPISKPVVVHAVAGAGKSTLIRKLLERNPEIRAFTHGVPDPPSLGCNDIGPFQSNPPSHTINILDEYPAGDVSGAFHVLFADPLQHRKPKRRPHFVKRVSHRLGPNTENLLRKVGISITGAGSAEVKTQQSIFEGALFGKITAVDSNVGNLLANHGVKFSYPDDVLGLEFPVVTVFSALPVSEICDKEGAYIALSRHTEELHVRAPGSFNSTS